MNAGSGPPIPPPPAPPPGVPPMPGAPMPGPGSIPPRGLGDIYAAAFDLYKQHWQAFITIVAVVIVPLTFLSQFIAYRLISHTVTVTQNVVNGQPIVQVNGGQVGRSVLAALVLAVLAVVFAQILTGAITRAAAGSLVGESPTVEAMYQFGVARLGAILLVSVLVGLATIGGFILLVVPGFIVITHLVASVPALVVENTRGTSALSRSWNLVKGRGWPVFGTIIVTWILTGFVSAVLSAPFGTGWFGRSIGSSIASVITMPFTTLVYVLIYLDLRVRKEGLDVERLRQDLQGSSV